MGFGETKVFSIRIITLLITIGTYPQQLTNEITFLVLNCSSTYNAIIWWPTLNIWRAATSSYHLLVKFPMEYGVGKARRDQMAACECYITMFVDTAFCTH